MIQRELLDTAWVPDGEKLELYRHDKDFMIVLGHNELMSTRKWGSEEALATMSFERIKHARRPHMLIGGYGMGFTLRAALRVLPENGKATVVEIVPEIIEWAKGPMKELEAGCLADPRVNLILSDVAPFIAGAEGDYDAILLDVDNGPDGLVREDNNVLYSKSGLRAAKRALTPDGVLAIWSAGPDPDFTRRLERAGFAVEERKVASRSNGKGPKHVIWFATIRE
ncbi:spermidine synthase [Novosphingobium mangrovi (ex Hu et al. 2023)]|uniref:Spermidine synthase n=1 Tax=Novosphingobium mangrovi (ex Hu et al. 2023) TaxID=2930094 RepID=A0ABT0AEV4_9SPHN|nr:spermidine synthase [Novosphingobium mangrovi (ex Hu et al. 2023)]MCJ1961716.1 spermidine synthase [Novosphingobium mangrovi (ex Hu et al. 2023)]MED5547644.1 spermidine synthase [Pseudomonadota bacterium]